jgi:hypothetical protein
MTLHPFYHFMSFIKEKDRRKITRHKCRVT